MGVAGEVRLVERLESQSIDFRPTVFCLFTICSAGCDQGRKYDEDDLFDWSFISFDYIEHRGHYYIPKNRQSN